MPFGTCRFFPRDMAASSSSSKVIKSLQGISLVKVQNRTYRVPTASLTPRIPEKRERESPSASSDEETETIYTEDIITYYHPAPVNFHGILIGRGGTTLKRIRTATGTRIDVKTGRDTVLIKGTQDKIEKAKEAIDTLIKESYNRTPPTHFLSIPLSSPYTTRKMEEFQNSILSSTFKCDGMDPSILVSTLNLHITLGVYKLLNQEEIERAVRFLKEDCAQLVKDTLKDGKALNVHLRGLNIMQSDPANAHVLYIEPNQPEDDDRLGKLCSALIEKTVEAGLMVKDDRPFKMHATLINTSHRKNGDKKKRLPFDARPILKEFGQLDLGTVKLDKLHLMKMGRRGPNNTYISEGSIPL